MELSFGLVCRGTDTELLMIGDDNWKGIENIDDFDDCHNNQVGTATERNFESHFEIDVVSLILWLTTDFDWRYGQANENSGSEDILEVFLVLHIHRNDDDNLVVLLGDLFETNKSRLKAVYVVCQQYYDYQQAVLKQAMDDDVRGV